MKTIKKFILDYSNKYPGCQRTSIVSAAERSGYNGRSVSKALANLVRVGAVKPASETYISTRLKILYLLSKKGNMTTSAIAANLRHANSKLVSRKLQWMTRRGDVVCNVVNRKNTYNIA